MQLLDQLRTAVAKRELCVHYQPKVDLRSGAVVGVEALVRWDHPAHGLMEPEHFLPAVRQNGLMHAMTMVVLDEALDGAVQLRERHGPLPVAVNLFPPSLGDLDLPLKIADALSRRELSPNLLVVEITEEFLLGNLNRALKVLQELHELGVRIAIDDFGTGYSALSYLRELPIDEVKLDRSFIARITEDPRAAAFVRAVVNLAETLGLTAVAEGVENVERRWPLPLMAAPWPRILLRSAAAHRRTTPVPSGPSTRLRGSQRAAAVGERGFRTSRSRAGWRPAPPVPAL